MIRDYAYYISEGWDNTLAASGAPQLRDFADKLDACRRTGTDKLIEAMELVLEIYSEETLPTWYDEFEGRTIQDLQKIIDAASGGADPADVEAELYALADECRWKANEIEEEL